MSNRSSADAQIRENIDLHERVASKYDDRHPEIYNPIEQDRLRSALELAKQETGTSGTVQALDFGCGTGNLTRHLLALGCHVTTADVTPTFAQMAADLNPEHTTPHILNGKDLHEFPDGAFDLIATYSVLHHIPDYLTAVKDLMRVLKPGGVLVIDHEASEEHYNPSSALLEFRKKTEQPRDLAWYAKRVFSIGWWKTKMKQRSNPRYSEEGDIHVWADDHIEWPKLRLLFEDGGLDVIRDESYLHCQAHYDEGTFREYSERCTDMHILIGRKRS